MMHKKNHKKWFFITLFSGIFCFVLIAISMIIVDPYFHYHKPLEGIAYRLYYERYINDGIAKNFTYDGIVTGTSMNQNFKTSEFDQYFDTNSVKMTFSGAGYEEISKNLKVALSSENTVSYVLWGLDYNGLIREHDWKGYEEYPEYLYDDSIWNDVSYIFNKTTLYQGLLLSLLRTAQGETMTSFDEYSAWERKTGLEEILKTYTRNERKEMEEGLTEDEKRMVKETIEHNILSLVNAHKDTTFLLFFSPYSVLYWESLVTEGTLVKQLEAEAIATSMLLECENIKLYSFTEETDITENVFNYSDKEHYKAEINSMILTWISQDNGRVTSENYIDRIQWKYNRYLNYDYNLIYEQEENW